MFPDDLKLMEEFDFKVPYTLEIFYESDDDKSPPNEMENNGNNQDKDLDNILSGIIQDITKASEKSNQIDHASSKNRRLSNESSPAKRAKKNKNVDGCEVQEAETLNVEYRAENTQKDQGVLREEARQSSINNQTLYASQSANDIRSPANDQCAPCNQHQIQNQPIMKNTTWQDTIKSTSLCQVNDRYTANTRQTSESNNNEQNVYSSISSENSTNNSTQSLMNSTSLRQVNNNYEVNTRQTSEINNNEQTVYSSLSSGNSTNISTHPLKSLSQMIVSQNQVDLQTKASECVGTLLATVSNHLVFVMRAWTKYTQICKSTNTPACNDIIAIAQKQYRETKYHFFYLSLTSVNNTLLPNENDHVFIKKFIEYTLEMARSRNVYVTYQDVTTILYELFAWAKSYRYPLLNELLQPPALPEAHVNIRSIEHQSWQCNSINNAGQRYMCEPPGAAINVNSSAMSSTQPVQNVNTSAQSSTYYQPLIQPQRPEPQSLANPSSYAEQFQAFTRQDPKNKVKNKRASRPKKKHPVIAVQEVQAQTSLPPSYESSMSVQRNHSENYLISSAHYDLFRPENQACEVNRSLSRDSGIVSPVSIFSCNFCRSKVLKEYTL